jgi:prepilin-type N-terminal cleavage/methylation domain-containing protein
MVRISRRALGRQSLVQKSLVSQKRGNPQRVPIGFTLLEQLVVVTIIGTMAAIGIPSFLKFWQVRQVAVAQDRVLSVLRQAQRRSTLQHLGQQASFRQQGQRVEWAIHPKTVKPDQLPPSLWQQLPDGVVLDDDTLPAVVGSVATKGTTARKVKDTYVVQFDDYGEVNGQLGRVTLAATTDEQVKRCVVVSTLLGAMRTGEGHSKPKDGRTCY